MSKDTGGPAFPAGAIRKARQRPNDPGCDFIVTDIVEPKNEGMTMRDYFAAKAMQAMVSTWDETKPWPCGIDPTEDDNDTHSMNLARVAYKISDAMIVERGK